MPEKSTSLAFRQRQDLQRLNAELRVNPDKLAGFSYTWDGMSDLVQSWG